MLRAGVTAGELAAVAGVDAKTVERWIGNGRLPHRQHRWAAARQLGVDETYLWPDVLSRAPARRQEAGRSELVGLYPDRASVPRELWLRLLSEVQEKLDVLVFSGTFFAQTQPRIARMLAEAAERGSRCGCASAIQVLRPSLCGIARKVSAGHWPPRSGRPLSITAA